MFAMRLSLLWILFVGIIVQGCGMKGPLTMPPSLPLSHQVLPLSPAAQVEGDAHTKKLKS